MVRSLLAFVLASVVAVSASAEGKSTRTFDDIFLMLEKSQSTHDSAGTKPAGKNTQRNIDEIDETVRAVEAERGQRNVGPPVPTIAPPPVVSMAPSSAPRAAGNSRSATSRTPENDADATIRQVVAAVGDRALAGNDTKSIAVAMSSANVSASGAGGYDDRERDISEIISIMSAAGRVSGSFAGDDVVSIVRSATRQPVIDLDSAHAAPLSKSGGVTPPAPHQAELVSPRRLYVFGPTRPGATLADVAEQLLPSSSVTVEQMMWALYLKNPDAFMNKNINSLKAHHVLNVPEAGEVAAISRSVAETEISRLRGNAKPRISAAF